MADPDSSQRVARFGVFEFDREAGELRKHGLKVKLHGQPVQVLELLLQRPGRVVTREELRAKLWPGDTFVDFEHGLNAAIQRLREALGDSADTPRFVETLPRRGYRFIYPVEGRPAPPISPSPPAPAGGTFARRTLPVAGTALAGVGLVAVLIGFNIGGLRERLQGGVAPGRITSIAVLPLANLSGDPEQEYFADGMTAALIGELAQISALRVISRQSVMRYKGTDKPLPEIARELNVDAVVEGSVLRAGERIRVTAQLIKAKPERHLWAETFDHDLVDVLALHSEVAQAIAGKIKIAVTPEEQTRLASTPPVNPAAYEAYLKGRYHWNKRTGEGLKQSLEYFQQAIAADPNHPLGYAGLADSYNMLGGYRLLSPKDAFPQARAAALKALEIDDALAEAHASLANVKVDYDWDWSGAEQEFQRAIKLNANYATAHQWYAEYLSYMGRPEEALVEIQLAREVDPVSLIINAQECSILHGKREYGRAIEQCQKTLELDPGFIMAHVYLGRAYVQEGRYEDAHAEFRTAVRLSEGNPFHQVSLSFSLAASGRKDEARKIVDELLESSKRVYLMPVDLAIVYAHLGEKDHAFEWLERGYADRSNAMVYLRVDPRLDPLRSDPRFLSLLRRMNFP